MKTFKQELANIHQDVLRFAKIQLRDECWVENIIQDTLADAIAEYSQFCGNAGLRT